MTCDNNFPASRLSMVANKRSFTYEEVTLITNNFERTLGEGGFGVVYYGNLNGQEEVAVKVLSQSSAQGYKQFKAEVYTFTIINFIHIYLQSKCIFNLPPFGLLVV